MFIRTLSWLANRQCSLTKAIHTSLNRLVSDPNIERTEFNFHVSEGRTLTEGMSNFLLEKNIWGIGPFSKESQRRNYGRDEKIWQA